MASKINSKKQLKVFVIEKEFIHLHPLWETSEVYREFGSFDFN